MSANQIQKLSLKIGPYEILPVPTGFFGLDGGAMFGTVPKVLWEKSNPPDDKNRIQMEARGLLLKSKDRHILIDTGNGSDFIAKYGDKLGTKFSELYGVEGDGHSLLSSLKKNGLTENDITDVILTHLHFDHAGGATCERNGKIVPTFPKARYYVQKQNLETASHPNLREKASYLSANFEPLKEAGCLNLLDGDTENIFPHVSVRVSNGHTSGHQMVLIEDDQNLLIYCGDVIPTSSHVRSAWVMGYDLNPLLLIQEKQAVLELALSQSQSRQHKKTFLYFEHDPYCDLAEFEKKGTDYQPTQKYVLDFRS